MTRFYLEEFGQDRCAFSGNPLVRPVDTVTKFAAIAGTNQEISLVVVAGRQICVRSASAAGGATAAAAQPPGGLELQALLLRASDPELLLDRDQPVLEWSPEPSDAAGDRGLFLFPLYLLGQERSGRWAAAVDVSEAPAAFVAFLRGTCGLNGVGLEDLRSCVSRLAADACTLAGQAAALSQWHQSHRFCCQCGGPTLPSEAGLRRACTSYPTQHKLYPRTNPVVIMLVESPDGSAALLGRSHRMAPGMFTCLSGFVDACESVEEAVRREVMEESRIAVAEVQLVASQPWPIGRSPTSELMIGCLAKASSYEVLTNTAEMDDVQWCDREALATAVRLYEACGGGGGGGGGGSSIASAAQGLPGSSRSGSSSVQEESRRLLGYYVPPPVAIAHHLIRLWATADGPWFERPASPALQRRTSGL